MKGTRLKILILSILLLTISSGLLFYKNLFLLESPRSGGKVDFEELRYTDIQINATISLLRKNMAQDLTPLDEETNRIKELLNIITDVNKNATELNNSINKIQNYFDRKIQDVNTFKTSLKELRLAVNSLNPLYNELTKSNIKFNLEKNDKKDFYRECVVDALLFVSTSDKETETKLNDDKKILGQILSFANAPNPLIQKFSNNLDSIVRHTKQLDSLIDSVTNNQSIGAEMAIVGKYYRESQDSKAHDGEIFLTMIFGAIVLYLISVVVILRKLN